MEFTFQIAIYIHLFSSFLFPIEHWKNRTSNNVHNKYFCILMWLLILNSTKHFSYCGMLSSTKKNFYKLYIVLSNLNLSFIKGLFRHPQNCLEHVWQHLLGKTDYEESLYLKKAFVWCEQWRVGFFEWVFFPLSNQNLIDWV